MSEGRYDLAIIGAGPAGLTAASFAARLGAKVALIEKRRIGGDCTWTGCIPSKALLQVARAAYEARTRDRFGISSSTPKIDMQRVREYVQSAIDHVYQRESPEQLRQKGIKVAIGGARFLDDHTVAVGSGRISASYFLIATGARPFVPAIGGLSDVPFLTYEHIFNNEKLPDRMLVAGGGPIGIELAQAYQRLGAQVTVVAPEILPAEDSETRAIVRRFLAREGLRFEEAKASAVRTADAEIILTAGQKEIAGDLLLVAAGRRPCVEGLALAEAGVRFSSEQGIAVDSRLRTSVKHIYAVGDVTGGHQFTYFARWQAVQAVQNALLPGSGCGPTGLVPRVTFTDPEVAHIGLTESKAREQTGDAVHVGRWDLRQIDRAVCDGETEGFTKLVTKNDGTILGATIVAPRAGEAISEIVVAIKHGLKVADLADAIHPYPTYSTVIQQIAEDMASDLASLSASGRSRRRLPDGCHSGPEGLQMSGMSRRLPTG